MERGRWREREGEINKCEGILVSNDKNGLSELKRKLLD